MSETKQSQTTPPHPKLTAALVKAQAMMEAAKKDSTNPHFKSKYSDLASVAAAIKEPFAKNGLGWRHKTKSDRGAAYVKCVIFHESGEEMEQEDWLELALAQPTPQAVGSALSYGRRYTLQGEAGLVSDDDDGEAASEHLHKPHARPPAPKPASTPAQRDLTEGERLAMEGGPPPPTEHVTPSGDFGPVIAFGKNKGKRASQLSPKQLDWYIDRASESLEDPTKEKWRTKNEEYLQGLVDVRDAYRHGADH